MVKGVSIKFKSYFETIPRLLEVTKFDNLIKQQKLIVLKPFLRDSVSKSTSSEFLESVLQFCMKHKQPEAQIVIAEGSDGEDTFDLFNEKGYKKLAEKYNISLVDLNTAECEEIFPTFSRSLSSIYYPKMLSEGFVVSLPKLSSDFELEAVTSLSNMIGAYPSKYYSGWFSSKKNKLRKFSMKDAVHDIVRCKSPEIAVIDASDYGTIFIGNPLEIDKQAVNLLGKEWKSIGFLRFLSESTMHDEDRERRKKEIQEAKAQQIR